VRAVEVSYYGSLSGPSNVVVMVVVVVVVGTLPAEKRKHHHLHHHGQNHHSENLSNFWSLDHSPRHLY
jgi:hypothetical protein